MDSKLTAEIQSRRDAARRTPDEALAKVRMQGKLTARERIEHLLDVGSFVEMGTLGRSNHPELKKRTPADGVVVGHGTIQG
ncbi:MAG: carboxyl transferase domain-containing protein, partial [Betaproteobacteria bacterium]